MKQFIKKHLYKILLGVLVVAFAVISAFGVGNMKAPSTYYQFGEISTIYPYNSVAYKIDYSGENEEKYTLDSVWISVGSYTNTEKEVTLSAYLSKYDNVSFSSAGEKILYNTYDGISAGGWQRLAYGTDITNKSDYQYFLLSLSTSVKVKVNELVFLGKNASGEYVKLNVEPIGSGAKMGGNESIVDGEEFDTSDIAKAYASKLIDESNKFSIEKINEFGTYENDEKSMFTQIELEVLDTVRNIKKGNGNYISETANPLGYYALALGTLIFGETTLGLRFMPALFAIATVILMFAIGKLIFGKEGLGLLTAFIYVLFGFGLALSNLGAVSTIYIFFILASFYAVMKFYRKGVSNAHATKGYLNLLGGGCAFALAVAVKTQSIYFLPAILLVLVFGFIRQRKAYKARAVKFAGNEAESVSNYAIYKNKALTCLGVVAIGFILVPVIAFAISYLAGFRAYSVFYGETNMFKYAAQSFANSFKATFGVTYRANSDGGVGGWALNYTGETISKNKTVFGNMILSFAGVFTLIYSLFYSIIYAVDSKANGGMKPEKKFGVIMPYIFSAVAFLGGWLFHFIGAEGGISGYYGASIFLVLIIVGFINSLETDNLKPLFKIGGYGVTISRLAIFVVLLAVTVAFALSVPAYIGIPFDSKLYAWNILRG